MPEIKNTGTVTWAAVADELRAEVAGMKAGTAAAPGLAFEGDTDTGVYRVAANVLGVATGGAERVRFGANGLSFNAGADYLGDYETGTWTPTIRGGSTPGTYTPTFAPGRCSYVRVGALMHVFLRFTGFSEASGGTGTLEILGGPVNAIAERIGIGIITMNNTVSLPSPLVGQVRRSSDATTEFRWFVSTDGVNVVPVAQVQTTTTMDMHLVYHVST